MRETIQLLALVAILGIALPAGGGEAATRDEPREVDLSPERWGEGEIEKYRAIDNDFSAPRPARTAVPPLPGSSTWSPTTPRAARFFRSTPPGTR